eukprot:gnl/TRDRNA2_/TRDRNA2_166926_c0_seq1.p1 gnl/TRDRNA2_/TRDRNA2_166926_c0~~gnl/TRDRNA2_/TRDRNA2_166926_c0_seq1.p1  ORF type:complete len:1078 (-),score=152.87 gnl/TRDRNA2_/TRDRNA2_166926_c0_seq1:8-2800(-)
MSWHDFCRTFSQCATLAGPGVIIGTGLTMLVGKYVLPYGWDWNTAGAFGAILAATDPVAVVALLKELGASRMLTMQIAGESLLNDGAAIVVWSVFFDMMGGAAWDVQQVVINLFRLVGGGVLFGLCLGVLGLHWLARASDTLHHAHHLVQLGVTICLAYLVFFCGENNMRVSGVLATIFAAFVLAKAAWPLLCSPDSVSQTWHAVEFFGNTVLFLLAGMIFYESVLEVQPVDWLWLLVVYTTAVLIRAAVFFMLWPVLQQLETKFAGGFVRQTTWKEGVVMVWGGLRGAVGLALAVATKKNVSHVRDGHRIVFLVGGMAGLTLCVNATTCELLLKRLGLTNAPQARQALMTSLHERLGVIGRLCFEELCAKDGRYSAVRSHQLENTVLRLPPREESGKSAGRSSQPASSTPSNTNAKHWWWGFEDYREDQPRGRDSSGTRCSSVNVRSSTGAFGGEAEEIKVERELFLSMLRAEYWSQLESGLLPDHAVGSVHLFTSVDMAEDVSSVILADWEQLLHAMLHESRGPLDRVVETSFKAMTPCWTAESKPRKFDLFTLVVFLDAHHIVRQMLKGNDFGSSAKNPARRHVLSEAAQELDMAHDFLRENNIGPQKIGLVRSVQLGSWVLKFQEKKVRDWLKHGMVSTKEAEDNLLHHIAHARHRLHDLQEETVRETSRAGSGERWSIRSRLSAASRGMSQHMNALGNVSVFERMGFPIVRFLGNPLHADQRERQEHDVGRTSFGSVVPEASQAWAEQRVQSPETTPTHRASQGDGCANLELTDYVDEKEDESAKAEYLRAKSASWTSEFDAHGDPLRENLLEPLPWDQQRKEPFYRARILATSGWGTVTDICVGTSSASLFYKVEYDDGGYHDLDAEEVEAGLVRADEAIGRSVFEQDNYAQEPGRRRRRPSKEKAAAETRGSVVTSFHQLDFG